jgi:hypothetical protein
VARRPYFSPNAASRQELALFDTRGKN